MQYDNLLTLSGDIQVFCFRIENVPYGVRIGHVLAIDQDVSRLRALPAKAPGFVGLIEYLGVVVPVIDLAQMLGRKSDRELKEELIETLTMREGDHLNWINALEESLIHDTPFSGERDPHRCAFGRWYDSFVPPQGLEGLFAEFDAPHKRIHALARELLDQAQREGKEAAHKALALERGTTLQDLRRTFEFVRLSLRSSLHSVLLYVTSDGRTPRMALRLDDINDILSFKESERVPLDSIELPPGAIDRELISDYLRGRAGDCFMLNPHELVHRAETAYRQTA